MHARRWKGAAAALLLATAAASAAPVMPPDEPGRHNMMLVGESAAFVSHLPMFEGLDPAGTDYTSLHRYQVVLEVSMSRNGRDVTHIYTEDRRSHPRERMYTVKPDLFVLPTLFTPGGQPGASSFTATVFRGHLERGGRPVPGLGSVLVQVRRVVRGQHFDPAAGRPQNLGYFLFGKGGELFLAHSIVRPPDFDQLLSVRVDGHTFTDEELARGVEVVFPGRSDTPAQRLKPGQSAAGRFQVAGAQQPLTLQVRGQTEFYFEEGELRMPDDMESTAEERRSGFGP